MTPNGTLAEDPADDGPVARDYLVTPGVGRGPGVMVLHSGRGVTDFVERLCHRFASEGYVALAPDLFGGATPTSVEASEARKADLDPGQALQRLEEAAEFLRGHEDTSRRVVGVVGLGYGTEWACRLAAALEDGCGGLVLFYGFEDLDWSRVEAPVLGHFAELDQELPPSRVEQVRSILERADVPHDLFVYPNTEPSFFEAEETARHDPEAARLAWDRTLHFLEETLYGR